MAEIITGYIYVKSGNTNLAKITVNQEVPEAKYFYWENGSDSATTTAMTINSGVTTTSVTFTTNYNTTALTTTINGSWVTGATIGSNSVTINCNANDTYLERTATITIKKGNTEVATITLTQREKEADKYFYWGNGSDSATTTAVTVTSAVTSLMNLAYVTTYTDFTTAATDNWITGATLNNGVFSAYFSANPNTTDRTSTVQIKSGSTVVATITITQKAKAYFLWSNSSTAITQSIANSTTGSSASYTTNITSLTVESAASYSWITNKTLSNPDGNGTFSVTAQTNSVNERTATFNIKNGTTTVGIFNLKQAKADNSNMYLALVPTQNTTFTYSANTSSSTIQYSRDNGSTWTTLSHQGTITNVQTSETIFVKSTATPTYEKGIGTIKSTGNFNVEGNAMSLVYGDSFSGKTTLPSNYSLAALFDGNTKVIDAEKMLLPATSLTTNCYEYMFRGCTGLTKAPALPATTLVSGCYNYMFQNCQSLTATPSLTITAFDSKCCCGMFSLCSSLTSVPSSIGSSSTPMAASACTNMFLGCTSLTTTPALPSTTMAAGCYYGMFSGCSSLTNNSLPTLPAITMANYCYYAMFWACTGITEIPSNYLPATTLATACYADMFGACTRLAIVPSDLLPVTTLAEHCYAHMFSDCYSLTKAPDLPAATVPFHGYYGMFINCSTLNYIKCLATNISAVSATTNWVSGVAPSGTFVKTLAMNSWQIDSVNGIPIGWTIEIAEPYFYVGKSLATATGTGVTITCASSDTPSDGSIFAEAVFFKTNIISSITQATRFTLSTSPSSMFNSSGTWMNTSNSISRTDPNGVTSRYFINTNCYDNTDTSRTGTVTVMCGSTAYAVITVQQSGGTPDPIYRDVLDSAIGSYTWSLNEERDAVGVLLHQVSYDNGLTWETESQEDVSDDVEWTGIDSSVLQEISFHRFKAVGYGTTSGYAHYGSNTKSHYWSVE